MAHQGEDDKAFFLAEEAAGHIDQLGEIVETENMLQAEDAEALAPPWEAPVPAEPAPPQELAPSPPPAPSTSEGTKSYSRAGDEGELAIMLSHSRARNLAKLQITLEKAPEELKPSLEQAIRNVTQDYDETLFSLES